MSEQPKIATCETCPAWITNGAAEGTCKLFPSGSHRLGTNHCMQHPENRHLMEPPAKVDERDEPEVTNVKVTYGPQDGGYCSDGSTPKPNCKIVAFVGKHVYDAMEAERDALRVKLDAMAAERNAYRASYSTLQKEQDALKADIVACRQSMENILVAARNVVDYFDGPADQ